MLQNHKRWGVVLGLLAVALLAACYKDAVSPDRGTPTGPGFKQGGSCTPGKWTGGGRIDPTGDRTAANFDADDETSGGQPRAPDPPENGYMTGKVTFGFNVFLASDCSVTKGEIEVNGHQLKLAWHVSIHGGFDTFGTDEHVFAETFTDGHSGGMCLVVGVPSM